MANVEMGKGLVVGSIIGTLFAIFIMFSIGAVQTEAQLNNNESNNTNISCPLPSPALEGEVFLWIKKHDKAMKMYAQCNKDLALIAEECNYDVICTDQVCELPK